MKNKLLSIFLVVTLTFSIMCANTKKVNAMPIMPIVEKAGPYILKGLDWGWKVVTTAHFLEKLNAHFKSKPEAMEELAKIESSGGAVELDEEAIKKMGINEFVGEMANSKGFSEPISDSYVKPSWVEDNNVNTIREWQSLITADNQDLACWNIEWETFNTIGCFDWFTDSDNMSKYRRLLGTNYWTAITISITRSNGTSDKYGMCVQRTNNTSHTPITVFRFNPDTERLGNIWKVKEGKIYGNSSFSATDLLLYAGTDFLNYKYYDLVGKGRMTLGNPAPYAGVSAKEYKDVLDNLKSISVPKTWDFSGSIDDVNKRVNSLEKTKDNSISLSIDKVKDAVNEGAETSAGIFSLLKEKLKAIVDGIIDLPAKIAHAFNSVLEKIKDILQTISDSIADFFDPSYMLDIDFKKFKVDNLTTVFPFSVPFDLIRAVTIFSAKPVEPKISLNFNYKFLKVNETLDLRPFSFYISFARYTFVIFFIISLIILTRKMIKW